MRLFCVNSEPCSSGWEGLSSSCRRWQEVNSFTGPVLPIDPAVVCCAPSAWHPEKMYVIKRCSFISGRCERKWQSCFWLNFQIFIYFCAACTDNINKVNINIWWTGIVTDRRKTQMKHTAPKVQFIIPFSNHWMTDNQELWPKSRGRAQRSKVRLSRRR